NQGAQRDRRAAVITEDQEARPERSTLRQRQAVQHGAHGVLPGAEVWVPAGAMLGAEIPGTLEAEARLARGPEVRRSTEQPWHVLGEHVQRLARRVSGREAFGIRDELGQSLVTALRQLPPPHAL